MPFATNNEKTNKNRRLTPGSHPEKREDNREHRDKGNKRNAMASFETEDRTNKKSDGSESHHD